MPLPINGVFPLLGYSRPGETIQSKPKQAMIIRMSPETLDALQSFPNQPHIEFEFGDQPGIHIGGEFFSMVPLQEGTPHDLYLRASSAAKKAPPFKLYANVVGKFTVQRELGDRVGEKVRESTNEAINKRAGRTAIFVDTPDKILPNNATTKGKKKKEIVPTRPSTTSSIDKPKVTSSSKAASNFASTSTASQSSSDASNSLRKRLVHFLVTEERTEEQVVKAVGGTHCTAHIRQHIRKVLDEVGEPVGGNKGERRYRLKLRSWIEVRPYEWPKWTDTERTNVARTARVAFKDLGILETDPVWNHVRYRSTQNGISSSINTAPTGNGMKSVGHKTSEPPKRGVSSHEAKEKIATTKFNPKAEIMMKDEGSRTSPKSNEDSRFVKDPPETARSSSSGRASNAARKQPGSGLKSVTATASPTPIDMGESARRKPVKIGPSRREQSTVSGHLKSSQTSNSQRPKTFIDANAIDSDLERPLNRQRERQLLLSRDQKREKEDGERSDDSLRVKRKKNPRDVDEDDVASSSRMAPQKRRKTEPTAISSKSKDVDTNTYHQKPRQSDAETQLRSKTVKRDASPPPPPQVQQSRPPSPPTRRVQPSPDKISQAPSSSSTMTHTSNYASSSKNSKSNLGTKSRRRSPVYTSSEEEDLTRSTARALPTPPKNATQSAVHASQLNRAPTARPRANSSRPLPTDRAALRARYNASYIEYLTTLRRLAVQRNRIDKLLKDHDNGSTSSITDSDGDIELLGPEELAALAAKHKNLHEELESIRRVFSKSENGTGGSSD